MFSTLPRRALDVERLRRDAPKREDKAFRYSEPGFCGLCDTRVYTDLDAHMIACHLELPCRVVHDIKGIGTCLLGTFSGETWGLDARGHDERGEGFSTMDCDL